MSENVSQIPKKNLRNIFSRLQSISLKMVIFILYRNTLLGAEEKLTIIASDHFIPL